MSASRPRGIELRRPWGSRTSTLVCTHGHATEVPTEGAPTTCPVCDLVSADEAQATLDVCDMAATLPTSAAQVLPREGRTLLDTVPDLARTVVALHARLDVLPMLLRGAAGEREGLPHVAATDAEVTAAIAILRASGARRFRLEWLDASDHPIRTATPEEDHAHLVIYQTALARAHQGLDALAERDALRAIIEGRTTAPTDAEIGAHRSAHPLGAWLYEPLSKSGHYALPWSEDDDEIVRRRARTEHQRARWWPLDGAGRPCAWPVVTS